MMNGELKLMAPLEPLTSKEHGFEQFTPVYIKENRKMSIKLCSYELTLLNSWRALSLSKTIKIFYTTPLFTLMMYYNAKH